MAMAVWTGSLSFGLVTVPVKLYPATGPKDVRFHLMDREGRRIRYRRVVEGDEHRADQQPPLAAPDEHRAPGPDARPSAPEPSSAEGTPPSSGPPPETEVDFRDLVRGYETDEGRIVTVTPEEIEAVRPQRSRTIDVEDFVELEDIDPVYFEKTYVVAPNGPEAEEPYLLLLRAMQRAGRVGIGRFVLRTRPHLVAIRPMTDALALHTLFFGDEVRDAARFVDLGGREADPQKLELAESLIEMLKTEWDPAAYADTYREDLLRVIAQKEPAAAPEPEPEPTPAAGSDRVDELMRALKESVEAAKTKEPRRKREAS